MKELIKKNYKIVIPVLIFLIGTILVFFEPSKKKEEPKSVAFTFSENEYEKALEDRLERIIEKIDGAGDVSVMVTLEGSALYSYATDISQDTKSDGDVKRESTVVLSFDGASKKDAVISGYTLPRVKGAAVVCSKVLSPTLQEKIIGVVSSALGINTNKIYVTN